jgi:hypothetical protein
MKTYRKVQVNFEREEVDKVFCDICKEDLDKQRRKTNKSYYFRSEVEMGFEEGTVYPDNGCTDHQAFDLCGECWKTKLVPWMATFGAKPQEEEVDF